jgi:hypothetical protein
MSGERMVKLADLWQRRSAKETTYFSGFMGDCQLLLFKEGEHPHPTRPDERVIVWKLCMQERDPARRPSARTQPEPGSRDHQRQAERGRDAQAPFHDDTDAAIADLEGRGE